MILEPSGLLWAPASISKGILLSADLPARLEKIRLLALDVDGVLTDGQILLAPDGTEIKGFCSRDGIGLMCLHLAGLHSAIITARGSAAVTRRAEELSVRDVILNAADKRAALAGLCEERDLTPEQVAFMGDDLQDLGALLLAGVAFSVAGCPPELAERVDHVTRAPGGRGAVREAVEVILKAQRHWDHVLERFLP